MAKQSHPQAAIDWSSASVKDGALTVELGGEPNAEWARRLQDVIERLDRSGSAWGAVDVDKKRVHVEAVTAGAEADLRHLLDSAAQQVNADFAAPEDDEGDAASDADRQMTETFRSFADEDQGGAAR